MPITFTCPCGQPMRAADTAVGKQVRCPRCQAIVPVPAPPPAPAAPVVAAPARAIPRPADPPTPPRRPRQRDYGDEDEAPRKPARRGTKPAADPARKKLILIVAAVAVVLLGCAGVGGGLVYYFGFSGPGKESIEDQLVGDWETDPEAFKADGGFGMMLLAKVNFNKNKTFHLECVIEYDGRWEVVSRDGNTLRVKLTGKMFGMDQSNPPTVTIRVRDKDHIDFDSDDQALTMHMKLRRVGTGSPMPPTLAEAEAARQAPPKPAAPPAGSNLWLSYTLDNAVTLELPTQPAKSRSGTTSRPRDVLRFTEYSAAPTPGPEVKIRVYLKPRLNAKAPRAGSVAEYVGAASLADGPNSPLPSPDRAFTQDGKPAAVFTRRGGKDPGVHLAVGDENVVCVVSVAGATEQDPLVKRVFESVQFLK